MQESTRKQKGGVCSLGPHVTSYVVRESGVKSCDLQQQEFMAMATAAGYQFADTQATNYGKSSAMFFMARLVRKC